ncbi:MAG: tRNA(Ile)-lysidine synthetase, partial [Planctomycetota bacterium]
MLKTFSQELRTDGLLAPDEVVVVGVSGGADSTALLHLLCDVNRSDDWRLTLHVAHLNHRLRGEESEADAAFVQAAADALSLPCTVEAVDVRSLADRSEGSLE